MNKVQSIIEILYERYSREEAFSSVSLFKGLCGDALLHYELYDWSKNAIYKERCMESVDKLMARTSYCTTLDFANGFAGVFYAIAYLADKRMIEVDSDIFKDMESYMNESVRKSTLIRNYDLQNGLIGTGIYYMQRDKVYKDSANAVYDIINKLLSLAEKKDGECYWRYYLEEYKGTRGDIVNTGLLHGMPSILFFLMICIKEGYMMDSMAEHIVDGLKFLENNTAPGQQQYTWKDRVYLGDIKPSTVTRGTSLGYCYGDLGIANTFIYAATCFGNDHYNKIGMTASENLIPRILDFEIKHDDLLWFCHGIAGLIYFANMFRHISPHAKEWDGVLDELLNKIYNYVSSKNQLPPGMLNGVNGVILSLLSIIKSTFIGRTLLLN